MTGINTGQETPDVVKFCPECGSPSIQEKTIGIFTGDLGKVTCVCTACEWVGTVADLLVVPFSHELGGKDNIVRELMGGLRVTLAKYCAVPIASYLIKWGFLDKTLDEPVLNRQLARYMTAISKAVLTAIIVEREQLEKERVSGN